MTGSNARQHSNFGMRRRPNIVRAVLIYKEQSFPYAHVLRTSARCRGAGLTPGDVGRVQPRWSEGSLRGARDVRLPSSRFRSLHEGFHKDRSCELRDRSELQRLKTRNPLRVNLQCRISKRETPISTPVETSPAGKVVTSSPCYEPSRVWLTLETSGAAFSAFSISGSSVFSSA